VALGVSGAVVVGARVGEAGGAVGDEDAGDLADDPEDRNDPFLLAAAPGGAPVLLAEAGIGPGGGHHALAERAPPCSCSDCGLLALQAAHLERQKDVGEAPEQREEPDPDQQQ
jgi:hypothetical protein